MRAPTWLRSRGAGSRTANPWLIRGVRCLGWPIIVLRIRTPKCGPDVPQAPVTKEEPPPFHLPIEMGKNPIALVRVKEGSKRLKTPRVLTVSEYCALLPHLKEPYRTMVIVAQCLGLRVSEIVALQWGDFDFQNLTLLVQRSIVHGRIGAVKAEYSRDIVPLDPQLVSVLHDWRRRAPFKGEADWLFANPRTRKPYHQEQIQKKHLKNAAIAAKIGPDIGWHTFRHTYRSWLDASGAPLKVQQELMRHTSITTTMNVYGKA